MGGRILSQFSCLESLKLELMWIFWRTSLWMCLESDWCDWLNHWVSSCVPARAAAKRTNYVRYLQHTRNFCQASLEKAQEIQRHCGNPDAAWHVTNQCESHERSWNCLNWNSHPSPLHPLRPQWQLCGETGACHAFWDFIKKPRKAHKSTLILTFRAKWPFLRQTLHLVATQLCESLTKWLLTWDTKSKSWCQPL